MRDESSTPSDLDEVRRLVDEASAVAYEESRNARGSALREYRRTTRGFKTRLAKRWSSAFDLLDMVYIEAMELGGTFCQDLARTAEGEPNHNVFDAVVRLHQKACLVASEAIALIKAGHASGAYARWRTLHEVAVVAAFIADRGEETARRYLQHVVQKSWEDAQEYQLHCRKLREEPLTDEEMRRLASEQVAALGEFGDDYQGGYGWAKEGLRSLEPGRKGGVSFKDIAAAVGVLHLEPHYRAASHYVHPSAKSVVYDIGLIRQSIPLAGPSNAGLSQPGRNVAMSLYSATVTLLCLDPTPERLLDLAAMNRLLSETISEFQETESKLEAEDRKHHPTQY